jgi:hypothetical protein
LVVLGPDVPARDAWFQPQEHWAPQLPEALVAEELCKRAWDRFEERSFAALEAGGRQTAQAAKQASALVAQKTQKTQ